MSHVHGPSCCNDSPHSCDAHETGHVHGPGCGHRIVKHDDHIDYIVGDHLHHQHGDHCDDHGHIR